MSVNQYDVAIIGGGPGGSTCGGFLKKYNPNLRVLILEREKFPRDHVGESQLPLIGDVLSELGVWDKVEAAGFPVKIGATYRWGRTPDLWNFEFIQNGQFQTESRPAKRVGQRLLTAFQVDRAPYDKILLDHAKSLGCEVREETTVRSIQHNEDAITSLTLDSGETITARHYVDASGSSGILRRTLGIELDQPTTLQYIALWDYWQNAEWAETVGIEGTRIQILSIGYGWIWFIPLSATRTSIGFVVPASYYKKSGLRPEELYAKALSEEPNLQKLMVNAQAEGKFATTKDWSFVAKRLVGKNWFLVGETAGFADPILSAGMTLAHMGAREVAYTILSLDLGEYDESWLKSRYESGHQRKIYQHIKFADFWYAANGVFTDLIEMTRDIAAESGLDLTAKEAWQWLGTGGFVHQDIAAPSLGGYSFGAAQLIASNFLGEDISFEISGKNVFELDLSGSEKSWSAVFADGKITRYRSYQRGEKSIANYGVNQVLISAMKPKATATDLQQSLLARIGPQRLSPAQQSEFFASALLALEGLVADGWVKASYDPAFPALGAMKGAEGFVVPRP